MNKNRASTQKNSLSSAAHKDYPQQVVNVTVDTTPNPHSLKFCLNQPLGCESWEASDISQAGRSPLAVKILGFPWAKRVFIGSDFLTLTKEEWVDWKTLKDPLIQLIQEHIQNGEAVLLPEEEEYFLQDKKPDSLAADLQENKAKSPFEQTVIKKIKHLIQTHIQPAVARDGGFIAFTDYKKGVVFLKMQGACSGCPSATFTLKQGIENHLRSHIPEVKQVVAL